MTDPDRRIKISKGQVFELAGTRLHECRSGRMVLLNVWLAQCAEPRCSRWFETTSLASGRKRFMPNRRCELHRQPGVRIVDRRGKSQAKKSASPRHASFK